MSYLRALLVLLAAVVSVVASSGKSQAQNELNISAGGISGPCVPKTLSELMT
jgi:hypothetical protein